MRREVVWIRKLKVAAFGAGYWACLQIPSWQAAGAEVTAIWNRTYEKAVAAAERFGIKHAYKTPDELFENADFDVADVITSPDSHFPLVMAAARHKKPVICQKPMASTYEESLKMIEACRDAGVWFAVHENFRFRACWQLMHEIVESGVLGTVKRAEITLCSAGAEGLKWEPSLAAMDHMALRDMGPHAFDLARLLFGEAESLYCRQLSSHSDNSVMDTAVTYLQMKGGAHVTCEICTDKAAGAFISGTDGILSFGADHYVKVTTAAGEKFYERPALVRPGYIREENWQNHGGEGIMSIRTCNESLMNAYLRGEAAQTSGEYTLKTMEMVFKAIKSADENIVCDLSL